MVSGARGRALPLRDCAFAGACTFPGNPRLAYFFRRVRLNRPPARDLVKSWSDYLARLWPVTPDVCAAISMVLDIYAAALDRCITGITATHNVSYFYYAGCFARLCPRQRQRSTSLGYALKLDMLVVLAVFAFVG